MFTFPIFMWLFLVTHFANISAVPLQVVSALVIFIETTQVVWSFILVHNTAQM